MNKKKEETAVPFITRDNLWEDIGFSPAEAVELKVKSEIYMELMGYIRQRGFTQAELVKLLDIHQPDASFLMNGRVSKFSVGKLIQFAAKLNLTASVKITVPKTLQTSHAMSKPKQTKRTGLIV
jgi:predicted XRE-type DNA-binding protein